MFKLILTVFTLTNLVLVQSIALPKTESIPKAGPVCQVCTAVLGYAQTLLENNATETEVITFIEQQLCAKLGPLNSICVQYMEANGRAILYELGQKIDPSVVCNHFGLCQTLNLPPHPILTPITDTLNCTLCKLVFKQVVDVLKTNATQAEILNLLENNLCNATGRFSPECRLLIKQFGPTLIFELANGINPDSLCLLIGMCKSQEKPLLRQLQQVKVAEPKVKNDIYCVVCQYAVTFIDNELKNNVTTQAIISALDKVCSVAPASLRDQCTTIINSYGFQIIELLIQLADPTKVCQVIKLCQ